MALAAGKLRHRIEIQYPMIVVNAYGERTESWATLATVWAAVEPLSAKEFTAAQQMQSKVSTRITIRRRADVTAVMRIVFRGKIFNIEGVLSDPVSGLEYMTLPCSEGLGADDIPIVSTANLLYNGAYVTYNGVGVTYNGN